MTTAFPYRFFVFPLLVLPLMSSGQNSSWDMPGKASKKVGTKVTKEKNRIKKFKDHVRQWGLDSNYKHGLLIGGKLNSNGWSGSVYYQKRISPTQSGIWQLSFSEIKHDKQIKQEPTRTAYPELGKPTPFIFGKINNLYTLQIGYGREHILLPNVVDDNLSVSFRWQGGFSLAMLKPYYLRLVHRDFIPYDTAFMTEEKYSAANSELFLKNEQILGTSKWKKGLEEIQYVPGFFINSAIVIEPVKNKTFVQVITLGVEGALYPKSLPIMASMPANNWQACIFAGLAIGKRWK